MFSSKKSASIACSNIAILCLCAAFVCINWNQSAFHLFVTAQLRRIWSHLLLHPAFLAIMTLLPSPTTCVVATSVRGAAAPSTTQARAMAFVTAIMDYAALGGLFIYWMSICRLDGGSFCPFSAVGTLSVALVVIPLKDEVQCRLLWKQFISPYKLNAWPYCSWNTMLNMLFLPVLFGTMNLLCLCLSGLVYFESSIFTPYTVMRIWIEAMAILLVTEVLVHFAHKWMHDKAYFLHKRHHQASANVMAFHASSFDLCDLLLEFGAGVPLLIVIKKVLGLEPQVHLLAHHLWLFITTQSHSGNPYAVYFFNPVLDYFARPVLCHNLHHAIQNRHHAFIPLSHFFSSEARHKDIDLYNKHMKTNFPRNV